jgi:CRISPR-associated endonuclease Csn1
MILEGQIKKLADWQIYKAVHSAIQKRGYGPVEWASRKGNKDDEEENLKVAEFSSKLETLGIPEAFRLPCYFEAHEMGLWRAGKGILGIRQDHKAKTAETVFRKGYTAPRVAVEEELRRILVEIQKVRPELDPEFVLYGPGRKPFASYDPSWTEGRRGHDSDWNGLLGQKVPRFDNRILAPCRLIPRFHAVRAKDNKLWFDVHLLMKIHNTTVIDPRQDGSVRKLTCDELKTIFQKFRTTHRATPTQLKKQLASLGLEPAISGADIPEPRESGRTSFSRPALFMLREIFTSGLGAKDALKKWRGMPAKPKSAVAIKDNKDPSQGLVVADLEWLMALGDTPWEKIHIPEFQLAIDVVQPDKLGRINEIIGQNNNPVVRHRLYHFTRVIQEMAEYCRNGKHGAVPDRVCVEFVRDDFMSEKKKKDLLKFQKSRREENKKARERISELGIEDSSAVRRFQLWKRQGGQCPYTGDQLLETNLADYEIDHVVPRSAGGPDAFVNLILTKRDTNRAKGERTPYQWLSGEGSRFTEFQARLDALNSIPKKTKALCISPDAVDLVTRYTDLAGTAWIARLTQRIVHIYFGWDPPTSGAPRRFEVISGALTAGVRYTYELNKLLNHLDENKKDRSDPRHHILDAMVISFMTSTDRKKVKDKDYFLPEECLAVFERVIADHVPTFIPDPPTIEENFYGLRGESHVSKRVSIRELADAGLNPKFSLAELKKQIKKYREDDQTSDVVGDWLNKILERVENASNPEDAWLSAITSTTLPNGTMPRTLSWPDQRSPEHRLIQGGPLHGPAIVKPKGSHKGFFVVKVTVRNKASYRLIPVYVFNSPHEVRERIKSDGGEVVFFLRAGQVVELMIGDEKMPAAKYLIKTLRSDGVVFLQLLQDPSKKLPMKSITPLISEHGIRPFMGSV